MQELASLVSDEDGMLSQWLKPCLRRMQNVLLLGLCDRAIHLFGLASLASALEPRNQGLRMDVFSHSMHQELDASARMGLPLAT